MNKLLAGCLAGLAFAAMAYADDTDRVLSQYVSWRGGAAFERLQSIRFKGDLAAAGLQGPSTLLTTKSGAQAASYDLGVIAGRNAIGNGDAWTTNTSGQIEDMGAQQRLDALREQSLEFAPPFVADREGKLAWIGEEQRDGATWSVVRVSFGDKDFYDLFLNPDDGALGWLRIRQDTRTRWRRLDDWRVTDGVRFAHRQAEIYETAAENYVLTWTDVQPNAAAPDTAFARPTDAVRRVAIREGAASTGWIDFDFFRDERLFLPGTVNGHETSIVLDSGADATVLDQAFADEIGLSGSGELAAGGTGGRTTVQLATGVDIRIGELELNDLTVAILDLEGVAARAVGRPIPVILGKEIFNETVVDIDYPERRIAFHDPARWRYEGDGGRVALREQDGDRNVAIAVEGLPPISVGFDIGQGSALTLYEAYTTEQSLLDGRRSSTRRGGGVGGAVIGTVATLEKVEFGGVEFSAVPTGFAIDAEGSFDTAREQGNLGTAIFRRFHMIVDYNNDALYLEPDPRSVGQPFAKNRAGFQGELQDEGLRVSHVAKGSPAEAGGWREGEIIVAIDGTDVGADYWTSGLWRWVSGPPGATIELTLQDGTRRTLTLAEYY